MKKNLLFFSCLILISLNDYSQNKANLVIFSDDGDAFYAFINGVKQNDKPETNVKVNGISSNVSLRIEFENKTLPQLKQTMALEPGFETTARIKRDLNQQLKLRFFGQTPIGNEPAPGTATADFRGDEPPRYNTANTQASDGKGNTVISSSTTTTTQSKSGNSEPVGMNVNMGGIAMSMNVTGMDNSGAANMNSTTSSTVTSSSTSNSSYSGNDNNNSRQNNNAINSGAAGKAGCGSAMNPASFSKVKESVESKPFSDTKMSTAKVATKNACLSVNQVKEICKLFSMDADKLIYAKYAYNYCVDKTNFYQVSDVFSFSSTADELNKFLEQ